MTKYKNSRILRYFIIFISFWKRFADKRITHTFTLWNMLARSFTNIVWATCAKTWLGKINLCYMVLGHTVSTLQKFVWILNHVSRSITSSLFTPKASNLVKWQLWTWSFMWWCHFSDWLKFETRPSSLRNSGMANWHLLSLLLCIHIVWRTCNPPGT